MLTNLSFEKLTWKSADKQSFEIEKHIQVNNRKNWFLIRKRLVVS